MITKLPQRWILAPLQIEGWESMKLPPTTSIVRFSSPSVWNCHWRIFPCSGVAVARIGWLQMSASILLKTSSNGTSFIEINFKEINFIKINYNDVNFSNERKIKEIKSKDIEVKTTSTRCPSTPISTTLSSTTVGGRPLRFAFQFSPSWTKLDSGFSYSWKWRFPLSFLRGSM